MTRRNVLVLVFLCAAIYGVGLAGYANAGGPADNPRCVGLKGAAYGMCVAAFATGCDDPATTKPGCAKIEEKFTQVTGETPPWTLPPCPCGTINDFIAFIEASGYGDALTCSDEVNVRLSIDTRIVPFIYSFYPGFSSNLDKQTCGLGSTSYSMTDAAAKSCIIELRATIENYRLTCSIVN
jgi:hypothetical protein